MFRSARPSLTVVGAFVAGLFIGWWVIGWWLWPVQWTNALPMDLLPAYRDTYVVGVAYALQVTGDIERARRSMEALGTGTEQRQALDSAMASYPVALRSHRPGAGTGHLRVAAQRAPVAAPTKLAASAVAAVPGARPFCRRAVRAADNHTIAFLARPAFLLHHA